MEPRKPRYAYICIFEHLGAPLSVPQMTTRLIEILKMYKGKAVPDKLEPTIPRRKLLPVVVTLIEKVNPLDLKNTRTNDDFDAE